MASTRLTKAWTHDDAVTTARLEFPWPHGGQSFSYDLGGLLEGDPFDGHFFMAEVKNYANASDQPALFEKFLAASYITRREHPRLVDHFMWITWAPFKATSWASLREVDAVIEAVVKNRHRIFGLGDEDATEEKARALVNDDLAKEVADRVWLIVLSEKQEDLVISTEHRSWLVAERIRRAG